MSGSDKEDEMSPDATNGVKRALRVIQYGCGRMGHLCLRYAYEKGAQIVGAIDVDPALVGRDAGEVAGLDVRLNLPVRDDAEAVFAECIADVAIVTIRSTMQDSYSQFELAARHGVNVVSIAEESFYPWRAAPALTGKLDRLAKDNGCTISGTGGCEVYMGNLGVMLAGTAHRVDRIESFITVNLDDIGPALAEHCGPNLSPDVFARKFAGHDDSSASVSGVWIASAMGWSVKRQYQEVRPTVHAADLFSSTLQASIPAGYSTGSDVAVFTETYQGPLIVQHIVDKVFAPGDVSGVSWDIYGEPDIHCVVEKPALIELTCATTVNRLPSVVAAPPGYVTTDRQPMALYRTYPLQVYVD